MLTTFDDAGLLASKTVRLFSLAASIITGKPVNTGDHDIIKDL